METIQEHIEVDAPISKVYNQWTQFEEFPEFMEGIEEVRQLDDTHVHWVAKIGGKHCEWDSEITEQVPESRIDWRATSGKKTDGSVSFDKIADNKTKVTATIRYEPEGAMEKVGDALGLASARVKGDLKRFKEFIESRSQESGAWRGEVHAGKRSSDASEGPRSKRLQGEKVQGASGSKDIL